MVHTVALLSIVIATVFSASVEVPISHTVDIKVPQIDSDNDIITNTIDDTLDNDDIIEVVNNFIAEEDSMLLVNIIMYLYEVS